MSTEPSTPSTADIPPESAGLVPPPTVETEVQHAWSCVEYERSRAEDAERELYDVQTENDALMASDQRNRLMASLWTLGITLAVFSLLLCLVYDGFQRLFRAQERAASHD